MKSSKFLKEYQAVDSVVKWSYRGMTKCSPLKGLEIRRISQLSVEDVPQTIKIQLFLELLRLKKTVFARSANNTSSEFDFHNLKKENFSRGINSKGVIIND